MSEEQKPQILTPAQQEKLSDRLALEEFLGIAPHPSAPTGQIEEQAVFEEWLRRVCPSGDVTSVQEQWLASSDYEDWAGQINPDSAGQGMEAGV